MTITRPTIPARLIRETDEQFFTHYEWCLSPYLTLRELFQHMGEELERYPTLIEEWQRKESIVNLYLFACAIECTAEDFLTPGRWHLWTLENRYPRFRPFLTLAEDVLNAPSALRGAADRRSVFHWLVRWRRCVEDVCSLLVGPSTPSPLLIAGLHGTVRDLSDVKLPPALLRKRMKIHEGYRCQDLTHFDAVRLADKLIAAGVGPEKPLRILGIRTGGGYFSPVVKAHLVLRGCADVEWLNIRPKHGVSRWEAETLQRWSAESATIAIVDDYPNTGDTLIRAFHLLKAHGVPGDRIRMLAPRHPFETGWMESVTAATRIAPIPLGHHEIAKQEMLEPGKVLDYLSGFGATIGGTGFTTAESMRTDAVNAEFRHHCAASFQARLKRLYEIRSDAGSMNDGSKRILGKSVGWGWLGYHAYLEAVKLREFVPTGLALRNGILFTAWEEGAPLSPPYTAELVDRCASYIGTRAVRLPLREDPRCGNPDFGWGWLELRAVLRRAYGVRLGRIFDRSILRRLTAALHPRAAVIDGRMKPEDWILTERGMLKTDYEHHAFGAPELEVVDPAYDVAGTAFEFGLPEKETQRLASIVRNIASDEHLLRRLPFYRLLYGSIAMRRAMEAACRETGRDLEARNDRFIAARDFLIATMNVFSSGLIADNRPAEWTPRLFFMDLDGVFDTDILGFPHTTMSGLRAIAALRNHESSVVLNTGRSIAHIRTYCEAYGFPGGVGEYGSVFFDRIRARELPLIDAAGASQLDHCRWLLRQSGDVAIDPDYRYAIRAYRFKGGRTFGLSRREVDDILHTNRLDHLTFIERDADTAIVQRGVDKGAAVRHVKEYIGSVEATGAIGDTMEDSAMLAAADVSYAPHNAVPELRRRCRREGWRLLRRSCQRGLLLAAEDFLGLPSMNGEEYPMLPEGSGPLEILEDILRAAEQPRIGKIMMGFVHGR